MKITGVRCRTCGREVSHVVPVIEGTDDFLIRHEDELARKHEETCPGPVQRFVAEEVVR